jgi:serine protease Do
VFREAASPYEPPAPPKPFDSENPPGYTAARYAPLPLRNFWPEADAEKPEPPGPRSAVPPPDALPQKGVLPDPWAVRAFAEPSADPWAVRATPSRPKPKRGWLVGFICLLVAAFFATGALLVTADRQGLWDFLPGNPAASAPPTTVPTPGRNPDNPPATAGPNISGNNPLDDSGDTALETQDRPGSVPSGGQALTIPQIAKKALPSVVGIVSGGEDDPYGISSGSGIIMSADGYIITNNHVVEGYGTIKVILNNGDTYDVLQVRTDRNTDLAVLKIDAVGLTPAEFGNSDRMEVGDLAVVIGNPLGMELQSTVTNGIISAINRDIVIEDLRMTMLQTNCAINPGNSGGPLINEYGQVIGIISSKIMSDYFSSSVVEGLGFAIPINTAQPIINELITRGFVKGRPAIGITGRTLDERTARYLGVPQGVQVATVDPASDAARQGLQVDDIILFVNGTPVYTLQDINLIKNDLQVGDEMTVTVYRPSEEREVDDITFVLVDSGDMNG